MRPGPSVLRAAAAGRGECVGLRALQSRRIATNAAVREPGVELPRGTPPVQTPSRQTARERIQAIEKAKPFSDFLTDNFQRQHDYLRISITERCNLRCLYCMPEEGIPLSPPATMLTTPEIFYLSSLFVSQGVTKIRLTGGEPTVRRDIVPLMQQIGSLRPKGLRELALTTNGISLHRKLDAMVEAGLTGINLSLDTLDPFQFQIMTRRKGFDAVMKSIDRILEMNKLGANVKLKVNCVVMRGLNEREILPFVEMGREKDIEVRFIEYMPFGGNKWSENKMISFQEMVDIIRTKYPGLARIPGHKNDTSKTYKVPGFVGKVGFITSMTNDFCSSCNRLRITSDGNLKVCLHGNDEVSLRDLLRQDNNSEPIDEAAFERIKQLELDRHHGRLSDSTILGWGPRERELLSVIGQAVKRKAEKHADMGDLATMQNRPMILIDQQQREYKNVATKRKPVSTATGILASNAYLNPLLGHSLSSARAFSTVSANRDADVNPDDPFNADIKAPRNEKMKLKRNREHTKALQVEQKSRLLRELQPTDSQDPSPALSTPAPEELDRKLADLSQCLEAAKAVDWDELFRDAQEARNMKNLEGHTLANMHHGDKVTTTRKLQDMYEARVTEIREQRSYHQRHVVELEKSCAQLKVSPPPPPHATYTLDANTTIDITAPLPELKSHLTTLQHRLAVFHPRLDALPTDIQGSAISSHLRNRAARDKYTLQTCVKVLVGRYREKTGVLGVPDASAGAKSAEGGVARELSESGRARLARFWNERFGEKKGFVMTPETLLAGQKAGAGETGAEAAAGQRSGGLFEEFNEHGFLEDAEDEQGRVTAQESLPPLSKEMTEADKNNQALPQSSPTQSKATTSDTGETYPVPSTRPAMDDPSFAAWALHQLQGQPDTPDTPEQARATLAHNYKAAKLGWGTEDDQIAAAHLPDKYKPDVKLEGYEFMDLEQHAPAPQSAARTTTRLEERFGTWPPEDEQDLWDPARKARVAADLALIRRATTLRQHEIDALNEDEDAFTRDSDAAEQPSQPIWKTKQPRAQTVKAANPRATRHVSSSPTSQPRLRTNPPPRTVSHRNYSTSSRPASDPSPPNTAPKAPQDTQDPPPPSHT
ncbi:hypothetical protein N0V86_006849 [Didymella sp. IMI 355093]|nr:hypothetical protein N0V86_006849 [Didymella sp. IMI 355093]